MTTFREYIEDNNILNISYAVRITGLPYTWTDGKASWPNLGTFTEKIGGLATRDFSITQKSDPLKPLETGNGLNVQLVDDGSDYLYLLFAPAYEGIRTRLTSSVDADSTSLTFNVMSSTGLDNAIIYCGRETAQVDSVSAGQLTLSNRGLYNSLRSAHTVRDYGESPVGPKVTTSPVIFKNRVLEVLARPVDQLSGITDSDSEWVIWSGLIEEVSNENTHVEIKCEPLTKLIESNWPHSMPSCTVRGLAHNLYMEPTDWILQWTKADTTGAFDTGTGQMGAYDTSSVFTAISTTTAGHYTYDYIVKVLSDSIKALVFSSNTDRNLFSMATQVTPTKTKILYSWGATSLYNTMRLTLNGPLVKKLLAGSYVQELVLDIGATNKVVVVIGNSGAVITKDASTIQVLMDVPSNPFYTHTHLLGSDKGYAKISDGTNFEIISFETVTAVDASIGHYELSDVERGLGGTKAKKWVSKVSPEEDNVETEGAEIIRITQVAMLTRHPDNTAYFGVNISECLLACLLSTDDPDSGQNSFEIFGYGMGLGINERFVDIHGITTVLNYSDLPKPTYFWIEEGKGKETLEELLKFSGCFLVTKRFTRDGENYYGISIETIDPAYSTIYTSSVDNDSRRQGTKVSLDHNERLIINNVSIRPFISYGKESSLVTHNAVDSITDYGASESLILKPTAIFMYSSGDYYSFEDYNVNDIVRVHMQIAQLSTYRWLGAFATGNYILRVQTTPKGLCVQVGDRVTIDLPNIRAPDGSIGISGVPAKCIRAVHRHEGNNKGADLEFRAVFETVNELAPCAQLASATGTTLTLAANVFSDEFTLPPFNERVGIAVDADWFDPEIHGDTIEVFIWREGVTSSNATRTISARRGNTITINSALPAAMTTAFAGGERLLMTFANWGAALSAFQKRYAYIADNDSPPLLGGVDTAKEFL